METLVPEAILLLQREADLFLINTAPSQRAADPPCIPQVILDV